MSTASAIALDIPARLFAQAMAAVKARAEKPAAIMDEIGDSVANRIRDCFVDSATPYGEPWAPLSPASRVGEPLRDTGRLMASITHQASDDEVDVGTNVFYAFVQNFGATIKPVTKKRLAWKPRGGNRYFFAKQVTIPARQFMPDPERGLPSEWAAEVLGVVGAMITQGTAK